MTAARAMPVVDDVGGAGDMDQSLPCPLCGYDLRGLAAGRCPECGHAFDAADLRRAADLRHPYLFEHGRGIAVGRFARTLLAGWRPRRFWTTLRPDMPVVPRRLAIYAAGVAIIVLAMSAAGLLTGAARMAQLNRRQVEARAAQYRAAAPDFRAQMDRMVGGSYLVYVDSAYPPPTRLAFWRRFDWPRHAVAGAPLAVVALAWPILTAASLLVFRRTLRQANIRAGHVARAVVYSADAFAMLLPSLLIVSTASATGWLGPDALFDGARVAGVPISFFVAGFDETLVLALLPLLVAAGWRLWRAHAHYLRLPHAAATVVASQIIVWLAMPALGLPLFRFLFY